MSQSSVKRFTPDRKKYTGWDRWAEYCIKKSYIYDTEDCAVQKVSFCGEDRIWNSLKYDKALELTDGELYRLNKYLNSDTDKRRSCFPLRGRDYEVISKQHYKIELGCEDSFILVRKVCSADEKQSGFVIMEGTLQNYNFMRKAAYYAYELLKCKWTQ